MIQDVFFRIGGATAGKATISLVVNSNNVVLDDIWAWRADHGAGVGWTDNTADTGLIVNGDNVTAYGLFVEHYFEVPATLPPSSLNDLLTIFLSTAGFGGILNVVNGAGGSSTIANPDVPVTVVSYP